MELAALQAAVEYELPLTPEQTAALRAATKTIQVATIILEVAGNTFKYVDNLAAKTTLQAAIAANAIPTEDYSLRKFVVGLPAAVRTRGCENRRLLLISRARRDVGDAASSLDAMARWWKLELLRLGPDAPKSYKWISEAFNNPATGPVDRASAAVNLLVSMYQGRETTNIANLV
jgi:hypothetical protein